MIEFSSINKNRISIFNFNFCGVVFAQFNSKNLKLNAKELIIVRQRKTKKVFLSETNVKTVYLNHF